MKDTFYENVLEVVRSVKPLLAPHWGKVPTVEYKNDLYNSPVTEFDKKSEAHLADELRLIDASISFVGEERGGDRSRERFWLVDPIDGTASFIKGSPECTTMLALIEKGKPIFSVIYYFVTDVLYYAREHEGAYRDGKRIYVSERDQGATLALETQQRTKKDQNTYEKLASSFKLVKTQTAGHEFVLVASGEIEGRICFDPYGQDYDYASGTLLVSEAGGVVTNIGSRSYDYRNLDFIAANKNVHTFLTEGERAIFPANQVQSRSRYE